MHDFNSQNLSNSLYSLACLERIAGPKLWEAALPPDKKSDCFDEDVHQLYLATQWAQEIRGIKSSDVMAEEFQKMKGKGKAKKTTTSRLEERVSKGLDQLFSGEDRFEPQVWVEEIGSYVDFARGRTIIQVDGPSHYLSNGNPNGSTRFQTRLLEKYGYAVLRIGYKEIDRVSDRALKDMVGCLLNL